MFEHNLKKKKFFENIFKQFSKKNINFKIHFKPQKNVE